MWVYLGKNILGRGVHGKVQREGHVGQIGQKRGGQWQAYSEGMEEQWEGKSEIRGIGYGWASKPLLGLGFYCE